MSSVNILSSPPKTFARSPTPVDSSSPLPSTQAIFGCQLSENRPRKFETANVQRDGFGGLSSTRSLLKTKIGAENLHIRSPKNASPGVKALSPKRFKSLTTLAKRADLGGSCENDHEDPIQDESADYVPVDSKKLSMSARSLKRFNSAPSATSLSDTHTSKPRDGLGAAHKEAQNVEMVDDPFELPSSHPAYAEDRVPKIRKGDTPRSRQPMSPLNIELAVSRKTDWTPTKDTTEDLGDDSPSVSLSRSFSAGLLGSFGYNGDTAVVTPASLHEIDTAPTKRRRLDIVETGAPKAAKDMLPPKTSIVKKPKAPPKKALTITGLATSNCFLPGQCGLRAHSSRSVSLYSGSGPRSESEGCKEAKDVQEGPSKSTLVSPASAIKALENQDALFGSASQLARDESPSLLRDTLEAIKQSESFVFSSPLRTQETDPMSIESTTPRALAGIFRFTKTRGLWAAAGRDEDNALLHVDAIDIDSFNTPELRRAFPGKDVLLQQDTSRVREPKSPEKQSSPMRGGDASYRDSDQLWDIDDIETPMAAIRSTTLPKIQIRAFHTTTEVKSPRKRSLTPPLDSVEPTNDTAAPPLAKPPKKRTPKKPAFAGLTTDKLQKQIAAYGFKPMKKREQMIATLEKCWDQKHTSLATAPTAQPALVVEEIDDSLKHGDYLSSVHDLATRPVPKEKKVPKPREPKKPKEVILRKKREPKVVKKKEADDAIAAPKVVRKRKSKAMLSEEKVIDVDDLQLVDGDVLTVEAAMALAEGAIAKVAAGRAVVGGVKAKETVEGKEKVAVAAKARTKPKAKATARTSTKTTRKPSPAPLPRPPSAPPLPLESEAPIPTLSLPHSQPH